MIEANNNSPTEKDLANMHEIYHAILALNPDLQNKIKYKINGKITTPPDQLSCSSNEYRKAFKQFHIEYLKSNKDSDDDHPLGNHGLSYE